jgi:hypothetical protein
MVRIGSMNGLDVTGAAVTLSSWHLAVDASPARDHSDRRTDGQLHGQQEGIMYLFTRSVSFAPGHVADSMAWAVAMNERVNAGTDLDVGLFSRTFSPGLGTVAFATFVEELQALETANDTLTADPGYLAAVDEGGAFIVAGGVDDGLMQIIHGQPDPSRAVTYVATVQTALANGAIARGLEVGVQIAQLAEKITGVPTLFGVNVTGPYGSIGWVTGYESVQQYQESEASLAVDPEWMALLDRDASQAYAESASASEQLVWRLVA